MRAEIATPPHQHVPTNKDAHDAIQRRRILAATSISYAIVLLDASIINVGLDRIATALTAPIASLQWVVNAYTLAFASLLLSGGTLGDRWGARNIYLAGLLVFTAASLGCGLATGVPGLVLARICQGVGAAMLVPCSLKLINHACPAPAQKARAVGIWVACGGLALAAGPMVGGLMLHLFNWRSLFLINLPVGLLGIVMTSRIARDPAVSQRPPLDLPGQLSAIVALAGLVFVLIEGRTLGWSSPAILAGVVTTLAAWALFLGVEARTAHPMLPLAFFRNGVFAASTLASMASAFAFYGLLFVLSLYYQQVRSYTPLQAGAAFLPWTAMVGVASTLSSRISTRFGPRWPMGAAFSLMAAGILSLLAATPTSPYALMIVPLLAIGLGAGFVTPAATAPAMGTVAPNRAGVAAATLNSARQLGAALGVAVCGSLVASQASSTAGLHAVLWVAACVVMLAAAVWCAVLAPRTGMIGLGGPARAVPDKPV